MTTTYDRPIKAALNVVLANGERWEAKPEDLAKFGYVKRADAYAAFDDHLRKVLTDAGALEGDLTKSHLNPLRYLVELAINHPHLLAHEEVAEVNAEVVQMERVLRDAYLANVPTSDL